MSRPLAWSLVVLTIAPVATGQPAATSAGIFARAVANGAQEQLNGRIDRYQDMSDVLDEEASGDLPDAPAARPEGSVVAWGSCGLTGPVEPVDLRAGDLLAVQVTLASRGARSVGLITMGRLARGRGGLRFPESRWVVWEGTRTRVFTAPGFEPDAAMVLGERDATVLSYLQPGPDPGAPPALAFTRLDPEGRVLAPTRTLEDTGGLEIDSRLVAWRGGSAVVLGHPNESSSDIATRVEAVYLLDTEGLKLRQPIELTRTAVDETLGHPCTGLGSIDDGASLVAAWSEPSGGQSGVWVRRGITREGDGLAARLLTADRAIPWGPDIHPDGVVLRRVQASDPGVELLLAPWPSSPPLPARHLAEGLLDPQVASLGHGGWLLAGQRTDAGSAPPFLGWLSSSGRSLRTVPAEARALEGFSEAIDVAVTATRSGALAAWIAPDRSAVRRLVVARLECRRDATL